MKKTVITCPCCGAEYLAQEIYIPNSFFGRASFIDKDTETHKIDDFCGTDLDVDESYICDFCKTLFKVTAKISFNTKVDIVSDFEEEYVTKLNKEKIFLQED